MPDIRDLNFQLRDLEEGPIREHFVEVQEVHDEQKIASLYDNGYAIHTETFELQSGESVNKKAPGPIVFLSARALRSTTGKWVQVGGYNGGFDPFVYIQEGELNSDDTYSIWNQNTSLTTIKIFSIYERP